MIFSSPIVLGMFVMYIPTLTHLIKDFLFSITK